jgi:starch synthase
MVTPEASPFAKIAGLADVIAGLAPALHSLGHEVAVLLPRYRCAFRDADRCFVPVLDVRLGVNEYRTAIYETRDRGVSWFFLDYPALYDRPGINGDGGVDYPDNHIRYAVLSKAALEFSRTTYRASILHCHDWQAGLVPVYLRQEAERDHYLETLRSMFTIHNLGYQGLFPESALSEIGLDRTLFHLDGIEFYGSISMLKGGILFSDMVTTVSRSYAREILTPEFGFGLDGVLRSRKDKLFGIVNGADFTEWDPKSDPRIAANYSAGDVSGKRACRSDLLRAVDLPEAGSTTPVVGFTSRFAKQKGFDILVEALPDLLREPIRLVILGTGDRGYEDVLRSLAAKYPERLALIVGFNDVLAHKIIAGADMYLIPSRYEPCGLNQIYAMRYGSIPVVRAVGGLNDTVDESVGFKFQEHSAGALLDSMRAAMGRFTADPEEWEAMKLRAMRKDYSWNSSAAEYSRLYQELAVGT